jgi:hypothetical protein
LNRWKNYFCEKLNVRGVNDIRQRETHTVVPVYKKADKSDCSNYRGISLLPTTYKILTNILVSRLTPCECEGVQTKPIVNSA